MSAPTPPTRPAPSRLLLLWAGVLLLVTAVVVGPFPLASALSGGGYPNVRALGRSASSGFVDFWHDGTGSLSPDLAAAADYWARFHLVKAVLAGVLLFVLLLLGSRTWNRYADEQGRGRRVLLGFAGLLQVGLSLLALVVLVANVQGAIAPLSSVLGLMALGQDEALSDATAQAADGLAAGQRSAALDLLVHDFAVYHAAMAALGALTTVALLVSAVLLLRRRGQTPRNASRRRHVLAADVTLLLIVALFFAVITAANMSTWMDPGPALLGFFKGAA